ncbi:MAG TPA: bacillithiol system redox-active protein YtxJ [Bryobacteraceae bacterium]|nr:bacillithiol system redox-active protein YtxJ [Bryobacteraceae bacterium]
MQLQSTESARIIPQLSTTRDFDALLSQDLVVIFKHSNACDRSWAAHDEITEFRRTQPDVPLYMVSVLDSRPVARHIETVSGVQHESPQVVVFRSGKVVGSASHLAVTADRLTSIIDGTQAS